jgi:CRISPR-associated protein Csx3
MARCEKAPWLAVMDPRHGGIVVRSGANGPALATVIQVANINTRLPRRQQAAPRPEPAARSGAKVVAFVGPPNSGKSVLLRAVHEQLRRLAPGEFQRDTFLLRACPDGEGNWFGEIAPDLAATLRYKNQWDEAFVTAMSAQIRTLTESKRLLLVDLGGRIDRRTQSILTCCTSAVIVSRDPAAVPEWRGALLASGIDVLALVESVQTAAGEVLATEPLHVRLGPLMRGVHVPDLPPELMRAIGLPSDTK